MGVSASVSAVKPGIPSPKVLVTKCDYDEKQDLYKCKDFVELEVETTQLLYGGDVSECYKQRRLLWQEVLTCKKEDFAIAKTRLKKLEE